jgi:hypothetical protein
MHDIRGIRGSHHPRIFRIVHDFLCTHAVFFVAHMALLDRLMVYLSKGAPHRSVNAIVAQSKHCLFSVNTTIQLKNATNTTDSNGI